MKLRRIGLLLALPACLASGLSPSTAWAGKLARAAQRVQAVVPESLKPVQTEPTGSELTAPAAADDRAFPILVTPAPADQHEKLTTPGATSAPEVAPPAYSRYAPLPESAAASTSNGQEPNRLPTNAPPMAAPTAAPTGGPATKPDAATLEALAHKRAVADPNRPGPAAGTPQPGMVAPGMAPTTAAPQLLVAGTNSDGLRPMMVAPAETTGVPEQPFGHNALRDSAISGPAVYHNVLREGTDATPAESNSDIEQTAGRRRLNGQSSVVPAVTNPAAGRSVGGNAAAKPAAPSMVAGKTATPMGPTAPGAQRPTAAPSGSALTGTKPSGSTSSTATARASDARTNTSQRDAAYAGDDREPGSLDKKSVIGNEPADRKSQQMFESLEQPKALTAELEFLRKRVQTALAYYYQNWTLNTREHSPWEVMHAIIAYGVDTRLAKGGPQGERMTAIGHLCFSGVCNNQPILTIREGKLYGLRGPGVQGHSGQFLAILAQSYLQRDYPLYVGGQKYTLEDLIRAEQEDCESGTELTFKLIGLMHYLPSDATWTNFQGQTWSLDRLVREEIVQPIRGAACGGTHRLMGLSYAVRKREQRGEPIDGIYLEAKKYIDQYHKYTFSLQNRDGSFSTAWFVRPEARNDIDRRMQTTGHILEWLCFSLTDEQLRDPRVVRAVRYITDQLLNQGVSQWEVGHLGHALHALQIYNERVFGGPVRSFEGLVTRRPARTAGVPMAPAR